MVYAHDSKSCLERDEGSSPSLGTQKDSPHRGLFFVCTRLRCSNYEPPCWKIGAKRRKKPEGFLSGGRGRAVRFPSLGTNKKYSLAECFLLEFSVRNSSWKGGWKQTILLPTSIALSRSDSRMLWNGETTVSRLPRHWRGE